jgi:hypothetical protein
MAAAQIPGWTGAGGAADDSWNSVQMASEVLPGICEIKGLDVGIECDTKKARGSDQPTSKDNGVDPAKFEIHEWMNESHFVGFQRIVQVLNPRRPGRDRSPVKIVHPWPNLLGITNIRILKISGDQPTARGGFRVVWKVEEWFDKPKAQPKKTKPEDARDYPHVSEAIAIGGGKLGTVGLETDANGNHIDSLTRFTQTDVDPNTLKPLDPSAAENVFNTMFGNHRLRRMGETF